MFSWTWHHLGHRRLLPISLRQTNDRQENCNCNFNLQHHKPVCQWLCSENQRKRNWRQLDVRGVLLFHQYQAQTFWQEHLHAYFGYHDQLYYQELKSGWIHPSCFDRYCLGLQVLLAYRGRRTDDCYPCHFNKPVFRCLLLRLLDSSLVQLCLRECCAGSL